MIRETLCYVRSLKTTLDIHLDTCTVKLLPCSEFNVNATNTEGNTPLHIAATLKPRNDKIGLLIELLPLLFDTGARDDFVNSDNKTPLMKLA